jgi:hypothetical protein
MIKINEVTTSAINTALRKVWYKICCLVKRVEILEESGGGGGSQSLQQVLNVGNTVSNFGGNGDASIQSTNFTSGRTLYLNHDVFPAIRIVDNANASNYLQIDLNTLNVDGTSYNWSSIVNPPSSSLAALPFTTDHLAITNNEYVVGDLVYYSGNVYRCIANNDSLQPDLAPAYWANLGAGFPLVQQPVDWNSTSGNNQILNKPTIGTVTSVGLSMPPAFSVANSPVTGADTLTVTGAGTASQYVRGDGQLATFPSSSSGGSSVAYYLNGSVSQGTIGGSVYYEMNKTPIIGGGTDFSKAGNGLISQFITDVADPNRLEIPAGNWNFEMYFNASSSGGTPEFYVELLKYNGTTFTSIASSSANPEAITGGTIIDLYLTALAIPQTTLLATDRLAIRVYIVNNTGGRTITMHTEDSHLCEIITNFAGGVSALNGLTANTQYFATGTSGTDFAISSATDTHTFNLPTASATNRGALSSTDWSAFNNKIPLAGTLAASPVTGNIRTTNDYGVWKQFSQDNDDNQTLTTGVITGTTGTPSISRGRGIHKGVTARYFDGDAETTVEYSQSFLESASRFNYFGGMTTARIYAESYSQPNFSSGYGQIVVDASNGLVGAANYSSNYSANSFVQKAYVDSISSPIQIRNTTSLFSTGLGVSSTSTNAIFLGESAGLSSNASAFAIFIGHQAGYQAGGNNGASICLGSQAGYGANGIERCTIIGNRAGLNFIGTNNIIIGTNISLPNNTNNAINIGNVLYGVNIYDQFAGIPSLVPTTGGRIGIGIVTPAPSAKLDISSTTHGFLIPRMITANRDAIVTPATGLQIYNTSTNLLDFWNGSVWSNVSPITVQNTSSLFSTGLPSYVSPIAVTDSVFLGRSAGLNATSASSSIFMGQQAGSSAGNSTGCVFIGNACGRAAQNSPNSVMLGNGTGFGVQGANSVLIGNNVGSFFGTNSIGANNIIIGTNISLPNATTNAINLGGVLFGVNTYATTTGDPSIAATATGRIGVGVVTPTARLHIAASTTAQALMRLTVGPAPTSPNDGDIWLESNTQTGLKIRLAGVTRTFTVT